MIHLYKRYVKKDIEYVQLTVEGNSKVAVKNVIDEIEEIFNATKENRLNQSICVKVDATKVKKENLLAQLVAFSLYVYRNIHYLDVKMVMIQTDSLPQEITDKDEELFLLLRNRGGKWIDYLNIEGVDWKIMNAIINRNIEELIEKFNQINAKYKEIISKNNGSAMEIKPRHKFNFSSFNVNLLELYNRCFNELMHLLSPSHAYNVNPSFQRELVWDVEKKRKFIESIINDIPIGAFYVNVPKTFDIKNNLSEGYGGLIWDGKQRLHALHSFILSEFDVEIDGKPVYYHEAPTFFTNVFDRLTVPVFESRFDTLEEIIEAYVIINSAQVKHTDRDLQKAMDVLKASQLSK